MYDRITHVRGPATKKEPDTLQLLNTLKSAGQQLGVCQVNQGETTSSTVMTKMGFAAPVGSVLSYQLSISEGSFEVLCNLPPMQPTATLATGKCPALPHIASPRMTMPDNTPAGVVNFMQKLDLTLDEAVVLEKNHNGPG